MLTAEHRGFLKENRIGRTDRDRWLYSANARPIIDELCEAGLMDAASGELQLINGQLVSLYRLTKAGEWAMAGTP